MSLLTLESGVLTFNLDLVIKIADIQSGHWFGDLLCSHLISLIVNLLGNIIFNLLSTIYTLNYLLNIMCNLHLGTLNLDHFKK